MENIPNDIWLHIGEETPENADFNELGQVLWCATKEESNAIHYVNLDYIISLLREKYCSSLADCILADLNEKDWKL